MLSKPFVSNLKIHRKRIGLFQTDFASRLGLDCVIRISRWEKGLSVPSVIRLFKLAALYGVPPHELYPDIYQSVQQDVLVDKAIGQCPWLTTKNENSEAGFH